MTAEEFYERGNQLRREGNYKQAMEAYLEAMALDPESPAAEAYKMLRDIYARTHYGKNRWCHCCQYRPV